MSFYSQCASKTFIAYTLPCDFVTSSSSSTFAGLFAAWTKGSRRTGVLALRAYVAWQTFAGARGGVALAPVGTHAGAATAKAPVLLITV